MTFQLSMRLPRSWLGSRKFYTEFVTFYEGHFDAFSSFFLSHKIVHPMKLSHE